MRKPAKRFNPWRVIENVWVRLNGGDPEDELSANSQGVVSNLPKPKSLKTEKEKLILRLLIEVQDRDKTFRSMKARDAIAKEGKDSLSRVRLAEKPKSEERFCTSRLCCSNVTNENGGKFGHDDEGGRRPIERV